MAPELSAAKPYLNVSQATDIWALGIIFAQLFFGLKINTQSLAKFKLALPVPQLKLPGQMQ
jgi:hypothetical protein